jgi:hypothetical protein
MAYDEDLTIGATGLGHKPQPWTAHGWPWRPRGEASWSEGPSVGTLINCGKETGVLQNTFKKWIKSLHHLINLVQLPIGQKLAWWEIWQDLLRIEILDKSLRQSTEGAPGGRATAAVVDLVMFSLNFYVSRNTASHSARRLRVDNISRKVKFILTNKAHIV